MPVRTPKRSLVDLPGQQFAVEDVPAGETERRLEIGRREDLPVFDRAREIRRVGGELCDDAVGDRITIGRLPRPVGAVVGKVLREDREDVFAGRRQARIRRRLHEAFEHRLARGAEPSRVVVGLLQEHRSTAQRESSRGDAAAACVPGRAEKSGSSPSAQIDLQRDAVRAPGRRALVAVRAARRRARAAAERASSDRRSRESAPASIVVAVAQFDARRAAVAHGDAFDRRCRCAASAPPREPPRRPRRRSRPCRRARNPTRPARRARGRRSDARARRPFRRRAGRRRCRSGRRWRASPAAPACARSARRDPRPSLRASRASRASKRANDGASSANDSNSAAPSRCASVVERRETRRRRAGRSAAISRAFAASSEPSSSERPSASGVNDAGSLR